MTEATYDPVDLAIGEDGSVMIILQHGLYKIDQEIKITLDHPENRLVIEQEGGKKLGMSTQGTEALDLITEAPDIHVVEDAGDESYNLFVQVSIQQIQ